MQRNLNLLNFQCRDYGALRSLRTWSEGSIPTTHDGLAWGYVVLGDILLVLSLAPRRTWETVRKLADVSSHDAILEILVMRRVLFQYVEQLLATLF